MATYFPYVSQASKQLSIFFATYLIVGYDVEEDRWFQLAKLNYSYITNRHGRQVSLISDENTETMYMIITRSGYNQQAQKRINSRWDLYTQDQSCGTSSSFIQHTNIQEDNLWYTSFVRQAFEVSVCGIICAPYRKIYTYVYSPGWKS